MLTRLGLFCQNINMIIAFPFDCHLFELLNFNRNHLRERLLMGDKWQLTNMIYFICDSILNICLCDKE